MTHQRPRRRHPYRLKAISVAVASCFSISAQTALANPTGAAVVSGSASFSQQGNALTVTNSPGAIINWRAFSIGANEATRFIQQSAASTVLNRVVGVDPSTILGVLQSNGRVFLINPNGVLFGAGAQIDVAGLVASTLNLSNADFLAGKLRFTETPGAGSINNQGAITTPTGGQVYLIAPDIKNSGVIASPKGEVILAAGRSVELVDAGTPNLRIEITAPDTQAVNLGQIIASSGKIGIYAALVKNSGEIRADGAVVGQNGEILLRATKSVALDKGSVITASGPTAGKVTIQADSGTVAVAGAVEASATQGKGGTINIAGQQGVSVEASARIAANGVEGGSVSLASTAGSVTVAAPVTANASVGRAGTIAVDAAATSILAAGGQLSAGGGQGGGTVAVQGVTGVTFDLGSSVQANGATGGTVIVRADEGAVTSQGSIEVLGNELDGGSVSIAARNDITLDIASRTLANGRVGGEMRIESTEGTLLASGLISGQGSNGPGGNVLLLAPRVALFRRAVVDVSGDTGGGLVLAGGDYQGRNLHIQNASRTYFGPDAIIRADAIASGNGGKVIIWSDDGTQAYGTISARGGALSGNGGFVETSGKAWLDFAATVDTSAPHGAFGTLLLDPKNIDVNNTGGSAYANPGNALFTDNPTGNSIILATGTGSISTQTSDVLLQANNDITFTSAVNIGNTGTTLTARAGRSILVNANITTANGDINLTANDPTATAAYRDPGAGVITMAPGTTINAGTGMVTLTVSTGPGTGTASGAITIENITAFNVNIQQQGHDDGSGILRASPNSLITARNLLLEVDHGGFFGNGSVGTTDEPIRIAPFGGTTINLESHTHEPTAGIFIEAPIAGTNLVIGDVPFFSGGVRGVQTVSGGAIEINVSGTGGTLTTNAGTATCDFGVGTGGPICAGSNTSPDGYATVDLKADGNIFINNIVQAKGQLHFYDDDINLISSVAAVNITSNKGTVTITPGTSLAKVQAIGFVHADGAEGRTIDVNAPIAAVNIKGNTGVDIQAGSTIIVDGTLKVSGHNNSATPNDVTVNLNKSIAEANITATGAGPGAANGVTITGSSIHVTGLFQASGYGSNDNYKAMLMVGAPVAALNIDGTGVNGVTISGSEIVVDGTVEANADSGAGLSRIDGAFNDAVAVVNIKGKGTGAATSDVTLISTGITVNGAVLVSASSGEGGGGSAYVNFTPASTAPLAALNITGNGTTAPIGVSITGSSLVVNGTINAHTEGSGSAHASVSGVLNASLAAANITGTGVNGVTISGTTINVNGTVKASASDRGNASIDGTFNAPVAALNIEGTGTTGNGVTLGAGTAINVKGKVISVDGGEGSAHVNFTTAFPAALALLNIRGNGSTTSGVSITSSALNVNGTVTSSGFNASNSIVVNGAAAEASITSTAGNINIPGSAITASADDGGYGIITSKILLQTDNGYIIGDSSSLLTASNTPFEGMPRPMVELRATKGIGAMGNPIRILDSQSNVVAANTTSGDLVLSQTLDDVNTSYFSLSSALGGTIDITAEAGNVLVSNAMSNPNGNLALRSALGGGSISFYGGTLTSVPGGTITLQADSLVLSGGPGTMNAGAAGTVALTAFTPGQVMDIGTGALFFDTTMLPGITAGTLRVGDLMNTGGIVVNSADFTSFAGPLSLVSGGDVALNGISATGSLSVAAGGAIRNSANITSAASGVTLVANGPGGGGFVQLANGNGTNITAAGPVVITSLNDAIVARSANEYVNITGSSVTLNSPSFISTGVVSGQGNIAATSTDVIINAGGSLGGCFAGCWSGNISAVRNVQVKLGSFLDTGGAISAGGTVTIDNGAGGPIGDSISVATITAGSNIRLNAANFIGLGAGGVTSTGGNVSVTSGSDIFVSNVTTSAGNVLLDASANGAITTYGDIMSAGGLQMLAKGNILLGNNTNSSGSTINAGSAVNITSTAGGIQTGVLDTQFVNITGASVALYASGAVGTGYIDLGRGAGNGIVHATAGNIDITALNDSFGGCSSLTSCYQGNVRADAGNVMINSNYYTSVRGDISASGSVFIKDTGVTDPANNSIRVKNVTAGTSITLDSASIIWHDPALGGLLSAPTISLKAARGIGTLANPLFTSSSGAGLNATNSTTGDIVLTNAGAVTLAGISQNGTGNVSFNGSGPIDVAGAVRSAAGGVTLRAGDTLSGAGVITGSTINLTSVNGMSVLVGSSGAGLSVSNTGTTGDVVLTSTAPLFTVGSGGATIQNAAPSGRYVITVPTDLTLNNAGGTNAGDRQATFGAGNMLAVNGYSNASGLGVLMAANNVSFGGATSVSGALGVIAGGIDVNSTVQAGSVNVVTNALNVNGGDFKSNTANFVGTVSGDINVSNGGRIYGNPDVNLTVDGTIFINGPNSKIEAYSPTSIHVMFPLLASGGYLINGAPVVWDAATSTGFFAGGLPAVLGSSFVADYGVASPAVDATTVLSVSMAVNTTIAAINATVNAVSTSGQTQPNGDKDTDKDTTKSKDKDTGKEKSGQDDKSLGGNLKLQCN